MRLDLKRLKVLAIKTFDYFKMLVGLKTVAIDRHLEKFCNRADINLTNYTEYHQLIMDTATILDVEPQVLDHSIWPLYVRSAK